MSEDVTGAEVYVFSLPPDVQTKAIKLWITEAIMGPHLMTHDQIAGLPPLEELLIAEETIRRTHERLRHFKIINLPSEVQAWVDGQLDAGAPWETTAEGLADRTGEAKDVCYAALWKYEKYWKKKARHMD